MSSRYEMLFATLSTQEESEADAVGLKRDSESIRKGQEDAHGLDQSKLNLGMNCSAFGARLELAAAKALNIPWPAYVNTYKSKPDLEPDIEIRGTNKHWQNLILRPGDVIERKYILVTKEPQDQEYHIVGYIWGKDAMVDKFWIPFPSNGRPAHWLVPQYALRALKADIPRRVKSA